jgi:hypothetical protein
MKFTQEMYNQVFKLYKRKFILTDAVLGVLPIGILRIRNGKVLIVSDAAR